MRKSLACLALALAASGCVSEPVRREAPASAPPPGAAVPIDTQIAELERSSQPGSNHRELLPLRGDWEVRLVDVSADGSETDIAHGSATIRAEFSGRFLRWDTTMQFGARPHASTGFLGFDLVNREYQSLMINDMGTGMSVAHGTGDLMHGGIRFTLELIDRDSGGRARMSSVLRMINSEEFTQDLLGGDALGKERTVRRYHYKLAAPAAAVTK